MPLQFFSKQITDSNNNEQIDVKSSDYTSEFPTLAASTTKSGIDEEEWEIIKVPLTGHTVQASKKQVEKKQTFAQIAEKATSRPEPEMKPVPRKVAKSKSLQVNTTKISEKWQEQPPTSAIDVDGNYSDLYHEHRLKGQRRHRKQLERVQPTHDRYGNLLLYSK